MKIPFDSSKEYEQIEEELDKIAGSFSGPNTNIVTAVRMQVRALKLLDRSTSRLMVVQIILAIIAIVIAIKLN